jgi:serine protease AprX
VWPRLVNRPPRSELEPAFPLSGFAAASLLKGLLATRFGDAGVAHVFAVLRYLLPVPEFPIPGLLVDLILLGPADDRRQLQDSPILGDVWLAYAADPAAVQDLLVTPHKLATAAQVARHVSGRLERTRIDKRQRSQVAYLQGIVAARLYLDELLRVIVPLTQWWEDHAIARTLAQRERAGLRERLAALFDSALAAQRGGTGTPLYDEFAPLDRYLALAGLILWARKAKRPAAPKGARPSVEQVLSTAARNVDAIVDALAGIYRQMMVATGATAAAPPALIFQVSLNRRVMSALDRSVPAVKGDAARTLFSVDSRKIAWAVLDSGIDAAHPRERRRACGRPSISRACASSSASTTTA